MNRPRKKRSDRSGSEPTTARSDLNLRILLSVIFSPLFAGATAGLATAAIVGSPKHHSLYAVLATAFGILTLTALLDLTILTRRTRRR